MAVPTPAEIAKRQKQLAGFRKKIGPDGKPFEKHTLSVVRSAIRSAWMKSDVKLAFLYSRTIPDMDPNTRTKWLFQCEICEKLYKMDEVEVDHKHGNHSFTKLSDFEGYFNNILMVSADDLQLLCKDIPKKNHTGCHSIKTLAEVRGISFDEAIFEKKVLAITNMKVSQQNEWLAERGVVGLKNQTQRDDAIRKIIKESENEQ
ncbi:homing endonuclease HNH [Pseudomonas phage phiPMW]|uniref:Homing endonuclease HNH n=1 Tax=Pseudomonas phage phiPMW TaxID=1815582 RepID=A0A1S5R1T3_9CAUD|nr:HNH endonuclease [Pseudomonas phage phiPMW]ANA49348.1 homing endonuclease HNH [Pseudomonas phage phiPMW]